MVTILMKLRHVFGPRFTILGLAFLSGKWKLLSVASGKSACHPE